MAMYDDAFNAELEKCKLFKIRGPKGGHYNDRFELTATLKAKDEPDFLDLIKRIGMPHQWFTEKPESWCPPPIEVDGQNRWVQYTKRFQCFGFEVNTLLRPSELKIDFEFNSSAHYEVPIEDVTRAIQFEMALEENGLWRS